MFTSIEDKLKEYRKPVLRILTLIIAADWVLLAGIFSSRAGQAVAYFLPVGQGDSELIILSNGAKVLVDGGPPDGALLNALEIILGPRDRYIDAVVLTHPQLDHYGGLIDILRRYDVGIFASNGMTSDVAAYGDLLQTLRMRHVRQVTLSAGDSIVSGGDRFAVVWPDATAVQSGNPNFTALVMEYSGGGMKVLLTSDADAKMEMAVLPRLSGRINVLKVSHHGSKYSSAQEFLSAIQPQVAVIEVEKNSYGHPDPAVLERLAAVGAFTLRTDQDGLIGVTALNGRMAISQMGLMQNLSAGY